MLKITAAALLALVSVVGASALPHAASASAAESAITSTLATTASSSSADSAAATSDSSKMIFGQVLEASVIASPALITAGVCAALIGCCILVLALLRLYLGSGRKHSWVATQLRMSPVVSAAVPLTRLIRPSLVLLSISRT
ncbi:hypothetical protein [Microbacterium abyssi]|uniref:hypothetical protein n=1 Tax=Microbacterium TaxID=33882 RepID=UPI001887E21B|nr:hypothetical protein [Microbacterium sp. A18JL241]